MSKMKLLLDVTDSVCTVAESFKGLAESLIALSEELGNSEVPMPKEKSNSKLLVEVKIPTLEEVRAELAQKSREGKTAQVKELLVKHGVDKLSEIKPSEYKALLAEVEVL